MTGQEFSMVVKTHSDSDHPRNWKSLHSQQNCSAINVHVPLFQLLLFECMVYVARFDERGAKSLQARAPQGNGWNIAWVSFCQINVFETSTLRALQGNKWNIAWVSFCQITVYETSSLLSVLSYSRCHPLAAHSQIVWGYKLFLTAFQGAKGWFK